MNDDIYDIKPIPVFTWSPPEWVLLVTGAIILGVILFLVLNRRRAKNPSQSPRDYLSALLSEVETCGAVISRPLAHRVSLIARRFVGFVLNSDISSLAGPKLAALAADEPLKSALSLIAALDLIRYAPNFDDRRAAEISRTLLKTLTEVSC